MALRDIWDTSAFVLDVQWNTHVQGIRENLSVDEIVDTAQHHFPTELWMVRPAWEIFVKVASILPVVFFGVLGNSSLVYVIIRTRSLHTTTNLLIANMAVADLGTLLLCPWLFFCIDIFQNYILGPVGCHLDGFLVHALTLVAVFSLSAVSYDRVSAIVLSCSGKLSQRSRHILVGATWIAAIAVAAPLALFRNFRKRQWIDFLETFCTEDQALLAPYWHIFVGISVWAPLAIMAVCYSAILVKLDRYESRALRSKHPIAVRYKGKVARTLALIVLAFIICRVPFTALVLRRAQLLQQPAKQCQADSIYSLWFTSRYLVLINAAVNPLLYGCSSGSLRHALAACPATSWLLRSRKQRFSKPCTASQSTPERRDILQPRSPCIGLNRQQEPVPNISSRITPLTCSPKL